MKQAAAATAAADAARAARDATAQVHTAAVAAREQAVERERARAALLQVGALLLPSASAGSPRPLRPDPSALTLQP